MNDRKTDRRIAKALLVAATLPSVTPVIWYAFDGHEDVFDHEQESPHTHQHKLNGPPLPGVGRVPMVAVATGALRLPPSRG